MDSRREFRTRNIESIQLLNTSGDIKLLQFNVLAEQLGTQKSFPFVNSKDLAWETRGPRIINMIRAIDADIVCLEEVDHHEDFFNGLKDVYCDYKFHKKGGWHKDGTMILWKKRYELAGFAVQKFTSMDDPTKFGSQFFIVCDFEDKQNDDYKFSVLATHLKAKTFVSERSWQAKQLTNWMRSRKDTGTLFMLGDFNGDRFEEGIETIRKTGFENCFDFIEEMGENWKESLWTTFKYHEDKVKKLRYIDYMWYDPSKVVVKSVYMPPCIKTVGETGLPDEENPSDHIPLVAEFSFLSESLTNMQS